MPVGGEFPCWAWEKHPHIDVRLCPFCNAFKPHLSRFQRMRRFWRAAIRCDSAVHPPAFVVKSRGAVGDALRKTSARYGRLILTRRPGVPRDRLQYFPVSGKAASLPGRRGCVSRAQSQSAPAAPRPHDSGAGSTAGRAESAGGQPLGRRRRLIGRSVSRCGRSGAGARPDPASIVPATVGREKETGRAMPPDPITVFEVRIARPP